ncbi:HutD/Ves family protein [Paeniglutamicibacter kerguelensis]|uniref:Environmental stress-induced protein Ves n=1 Tax=Paeniglutamicibacter kerguelensis TaxID=254788 RepID=A0ABS4X9A5_9MICC|nr:HutD family protein [Paeniglutamicibacter kerguelensis]MBP2385041.1 environmental stress-induced protein Ves [Paeniglutamicibacter kerguelensis]
MDAPQPLSLSPGTVIAYSGISPAPWRNGGGVTRQIVSGKLGVLGTLEAVPGDGWDWRLSIADVESEGPFSAFAGMTRILTVIEGEGLAINIDGVEQRLGRYEPLQFDGGAATSSTLPAGPIRDFNLITRSGTVNGQIDIEELSPEHPRKLFAGQLGVLLQGRARLLAGESKHRPLERYDTVVGGGEDAPAITGSGLLAVVSLQEGRP